MSSKRIQMVKQGFLRKYGKHLDSFVLSPWKKFNVELDSDGNFSWYKKKKDNTFGTVKLSKIYEYFTIGSNCRAMPFSPQLPPDGKLDNLFAFPEEPNKKSKIHFFLCEDENDFKKWMSAIYSFFPIAPTNPQQQLQTSDAIHQQYGNMTHQPPFMPPNPYSPSPFSYFPVTPPNPVNYSMPPIGFESFNNNNVPQPPYPPPPDQLPWNSPYPTQFLPQHPNYYQQPQQQQQIYYPQTQFDYYTQQQQQQLPATMTTTPQQNFYPPTQQQPDFYQQQQQQSNNVFQQPPYPHQHPPPPQPPPPQQQLNIHQQQPLPPNQQQQHNIYPQQPGFYNNQADQMGVNAPGIQSQTHPQSVKGKDKFLKKFGKMAAGKKNVKSKRSPILSLSIGTANVGNMLEKCRDVVDMVNGKGLDFCCLQETKRKIDGAGMCGDYKFYWSRCDDKMKTGVGILINKKRAMKVMEVQRFSDRVMMVKIKVRKYTLNLFSVYAPENAKEKEKFFELLEGLITPIDEYELVVVCGDFKGQVGEKAGNYKSIHGGKGFGDRNAGGELVLKFAQKMDLAVTNTWFLKDSRKLITFKTGEDSGEVIDYVLTRNQDKKWLKNVTAIPTELCLEHRSLLVCTLDVDMRRKHRDDEYVEESTYGEEVEEKGATV